MLAKGISIVVMLIAVAFAGMFSKNYGDSVATANSTTEQISDGRQELDAAQKQNQALEQEISRISERIAAAELAINEAKAELPNSINPNEVVEKILTMGQSNNLTVIPLTTQDWAEIDLAKLGYLTLNVSVQVQGQTSHLVNFLRDVQDLYYPVVIVDQVSVTAENDSEASDEVQADVSFTVYIRDF